MRYPTAEPGNMGSDAKHRMRIAARMLLGAKSRKINVGKNMFDCGVGGLRGCNNGESPIIISFHDLSSGKSWR